MNLFQHSLLSLSQPWNTPRSRVWYSDIREHAVTAHREHRMNATVQSATNALDASVVGRAALVR